MEPSSRSLRLARVGAASVLVVVVVLSVLLGAMPRQYPPRAFAASSYASTVLSDGPVSYWRLGETSGTAAADSGTGGNAGTITGGVTLGAPGAITADSNTAMTFNGSTGYVGVPDSANLNIAGDLTVEAWAKPKALSGVTQTIVHKGFTPDTPSSAQYRISINSANQWKAAIYVGSSSYAIVASTPAPSTSSWTHLSMIRSGNTLTFYVNATSVGSITVSGATNTVSGSMLAMGRSGSSSAYYMNGGVDEVAVYSRALSASQIQSHYTAGVSSDSTATPTLTATPASTPTATATTAPSPTATTAPSPTATATPSPTPAPSDPVVMAAGDIACDSADSAYKGGNGTSSACQQKWTANQLTGITAVLPLGDEQYDCATTQQIQQSYDPTWGQRKAITHPAVGNHEYKTTCSGGASGGAGYYTYFGPAASPQDSNCTANCRGYYSYDLGAWHIIAVNSECAQVGGCGAGSPQEQWLQADLAAHSNQCTLAYWHRPYFSSGYSLGDTEMHDIWADLYNANADLVLNGHDHSYERFAPQDANGVANATRGVTEIVVGTGGKNHTFFNSALPNSVKRNSSTFGVLKVTLHSTSYDWQFLPDGKSGSFTDSGSASCH